MWRALIVAALLLGLGSNTARAQANLAPTPVQLRTAAQFRVLAAPEARATNEIPTARAPDHRWEGLAIGAGVVGLVGALLLRGTCEANGSCMGPTLGGLAMGALVGGVVGGLVGSTIPKCSAECAE